MDRQAAYVLMPAREGGWVVKAYNALQHEPDLLFAGDAETVLMFLAQKLAAVEDAGYEIVAKMGQV